MINIHSNFTIRYGSINAVGLFNNHEIKFILNDLYTHCGLDIKLNTFMSKPRLRREITDMNYNYTKCIHQELFHKKWQESRLDRAHYKKDLIQSGQYYNMSCGFLLFDMIHYSYPEQIYFRLNNAYKRYKEQNASDIYYSLKFKVDKYIITNILSYIYINFNKQIFNERLYNNSIK